MELVRTRECDGACCVESPRFPNEDRSDCIYHVDNGCDIRRGVSEIPEGMSPVLFHMTSRQAYVETCQNWPQNCPTHKQKPENNGKCCMQWTEQ